MPLECSPACTAQREPGSATLADEPLRDPPQSEHPEIEAVSSFGVATSSLSGVSEAVHHRAPNSATWGLITRAASLTV